MTVSVAFVIPVRHPGSVRDWTVLQGYLRQTLASVAAQTLGNWECVVVANADAPLPDMPPNCRIVRVDLPLPDMPDRQTQLEAYYDAVRRDKGLRIHAGLAGIADQTHVMVVDFDDFVHRRLVEHVEAHRDAAGWNISRGYVWSGGSWCFAQSGFHYMCGTSHIVRRDLLGSFTTPEGGPDIAAVKRRLGSHIFIHEDLAAQGNPLQDLPFAGAVYRVGNPQSTSGSGQLAAMMTPPRDLLVHPRRFVRNMLKYRRVSPDMRRDFTLPDSPW
ncbi:MAG: hypothetical protein ACK41U_17160 [Paracoccus sp. (in: a-proteobacteria)]|uniref:hypothetical protein n=1 Tax=Paracoccus sp. TaxID=267 RepID=UPI003919629C